MREIKFRAYKNNKLVGTFTPLDEDLPHDLPKAVVWCQFTGLLDKAGKEIYESDCVSSKFNSAREGILEVNGKIVMDDFMWCLETENEFYSINRLHDLQVTGNIYESEGR